MKVFKYIILIFAISITHSACTKFNEYTVRGIITNVTIKTNIIRNNTKYREVILRLANTKTNQTSIKNLLVLIPTDNRDSESFPIENDKIVNEFPIGAEINTKCTKMITNYYVIINTIQENIITKWPEE